MAGETRAQLPFANLKSFQSTAITLSFLGFSDEIESLLRQISRKSRHYNESHRDILSAFIVRWTPLVMEKPIAMGWSFDEDEMALPWPSMKQLAEFPSYRRIKLAGIQYK